MNIFLFKISTHARHVHIFEKRIFGFFQSCKYFFDVLPSINKFISSNVCQLPPPPLFYQYRTCIRGFKPPTYPLGLVNPPQFLTECYFDKNVFYCIRVILVWWIFGMKFWHHQYCLRLTPKEVRYSIHIYYFPNLLWN